MRDVVRSIPGRISEGGSPWGVFVAVALLSLQFEYFRIFLPFGRIRLVPIDIITALGFVAWLWAFQADSLTLERTDRLLLLAVLLFTAWIGLVLTWSPSLLRGLTKWLLLIRDVMLLVVIITSITSEDLEWVNRVFFRVMALIAGLSLIIFLTGALGSPWDALYDITVIQPYTFTRLQWFVTDPNFFGIYLLLALFSGVAYIHRAGGHPIDWIGFVVILLALLNTMSRSAIGLLLGFAVFFLGARLGGWSLWSGYSMYNGRVIGSSFKSRISRRKAFLALSLLGVILLLFGQSYLYRFSLSISRFHLWQPLLEGFEGWTTVVGHGLRSALREIGRYPHNSYLGLMYDAGLVGLALYVTVASLITYSGFRQWFSGELGSVAPFWWIWLAMLPFQFFFSFLFQPFPWLMGGLLVAGIDEG